MGLLPCWALADWLTASLFITFIDSSLFTYSLIIHFEKECVAIGKLGDVKHFIKVINN